MWAVMVILLQMYVQGACTLTKTQTHIHSQVLRVSVWTSEQSIVLNVSRTSVQCDPKHLLHPIHAEGFMKPGQNQERQELNSEQ